MAKVVPKRVTAEIEGDFVVFLIGLRINKPWKVHKWLPVFRAMPTMIRELEQRPESGFLGAIMGFSVIVQYWRSFDQLEAYAWNADQLHWPAWGRFQQTSRRESGRRGHLARDLQSPRRRVRVCVQRDATLRPGKSQLDDGRHWAPRVSSGSDGG